MDAPAARDGALDAALSAMDGQRLLVAYSGGLDSTVLLHALAARRERLGALRALHVHHGLHPDADHWAAHCATTCARLGIACTIARVTVSPRGDGLEAAARRARHAAFADALGDGETLVLAHHRDDQAETLLLRLLRGAGSAGLGAMRDVRAIGAGLLRRPLIDVPRATLEAIAARDRLQWVDDPSNASTAHDRNHLRHAIVPALRARWPQADAALATSARLLAEDAALLADEAGRRLAGVRRDDGALSVTALLALAPAWRARVVRAWLEAAALAPPPAAAHARIDAELLAARHDGTPALRWPGGGLRRWRDGLYLAPALRGADPATDWQLDWDGAGWLALPDGSRLGLGDDDRALPAADGLGPLRVSARRGGERLRLPGRSHRHSLKHLLQAGDVPPWERPRLPLLFAGDGELLAAGDRIVGARLAAWTATHRRPLRWRPRAD